MCIRDRLSHSSTIIPLHHCLFGNLMYSLFIYFELSRDFQSLSHRRINQSRIRAWTWDLQNLWNLFIYLFIYLFIHLFIYSFIHLFNFIFYSCLCPRILFFIFLFFISAQLFRRKFFNDKNLVTRLNPSSVNYHNFIYFDD